MEGFEAILSSDTNSVNNVKEYGAKRAFYANRIAMLAPETDDETKTR